MTEYKVSTFAEGFDAMRTHLGVHRSNVAEHLGMTRSNLGNRLDRERRFRASEAIRWFNTMDCDCVLCAVQGNHVVKFIDLPSDRVSLDEIADVLNAIGYEFHIIADSPDKQYRVDITHTRLPFTSDEKQILRANRAKQRKEWAKAHPEEVKAKARAKARAKVKVIYNDEKYFSNDADADAKFE